MSAPSVRGFLVAVLIAAGAGGCGLVVGAGDYVIGDDASSTVDAASSPDVSIEAGATKTDGGQVSEDATVSDVEAPSDGPMAIEDGSPESGSFESGSLESGLPETGAADAGLGDGGQPFLACTPDGGPLPLAYPAGSAALQQLVLACVMAETCDPIFFDVPLADCITNDYLAAVPFPPCMTTVKTCDEYYACRGARIANSTDCPSSADTDVGKCVGAVATNCPFFGTGTVENCASLGGTCTAYPEDDAGDTAAGCKILSSCPNMNAGTQCSGTALSFSCVTTETGTVALGQNCPSSSTCRTSIGGTHCYANGSSCTTLSAACDGGDLSSCVAVPSGNQLVTSKCSAVGLSCATNVGATKGTCLVPGCEQSNCVDSCGDDQITLHTCVGGAQYDIDCTSLGFSGCDSSQPTGSSTLYTYCVN